MSEYDPDKNYAYIDPPMPDIPKEVFGINTRPLLEAIDSAESLTTLSYEIPYETVSRPIGAASTLGAHALRMLPLIEKAAEDRPLSPEDTLPYRGVIKRSMMRVGVYTDSKIGRVKTLDNLTVLGSLALVGIPARRALNRRIDTEVASRLPEYIPRIKPALERAEPYVEFLEGFDNPRQQFVDEIGFIYGAVASHTRQGARGRIDALAAAAGIRQTVEELAQPNSQLRHRLPLLMGQAPKDIKVPNMPDKLAVAAPEILNILKSPLPPQSFDEGLHASVKRFQHPKRWLAKLHGPTRRKLETLQRSGTRLLPAIRDVLPQSGQEVRRIYERIQELVNAA